MLMAAKPDLLSGTPVSLLVPPEEVDSNEFCGKSQ